MKSSIILLFVILLANASVNAQINVGSRSAPDSSAMLQISGNTKGFLPPRMTRDSMYLIHNPARGLLVFNTSDSLFYFKRDSGWTALAAGDEYWFKNGSSLYNTNSNVGIGTSSPSTALHVVGTNPLTLNGVQPGTSTSSDSVLTINNGLVTELPLSTFATSANGITTADAPLTYSNGELGITQASTTSDGYLSAGDYNIFNNKVNSIALTANVLYPTTSFTVNGGAATATLPLNTQGSNKVFAGPVSGGNVAPSFRSLVAADLPKATSSAVGGVIVGSGLSVNSGVLSVTNPSSGGTVTSTSVVSANGLAGTVANPTTTPAITLTTTVTGMVKGNGTALSAAISGTDYAPGTAANTTGIVKSTNGTGALTTATASDFPTLNQNTTGTAANITGVLNATSHPALTGDVTTPSGSVATTISNSAVTNAKMANMPANTFKANNTGSAAAPADITATQATAMLNTFTSTANGLVPSSGGGTANFLRADGTFAVPPGTNTNAGTVTSVAVTSANGVSGTVANSTTTPAISLTLGAITPTSVAATGTVTGSNLSGTNTGDETNATIKTKLGTASDTTDGYLTKADWHKFNNKADTGSAWSLTGNSHTNPTINFIGTTDSVPLSFRTNNAFRMILDNDGGLFVGDSLASVASTIANTQAGVRSNWTTSLTSSNIPRIGLQGQIVANLTAASNAQQIRGANGSALIGVANGATSNADIYGGYFIGRRQSDAGVAEGTGTLTTLAGVGIEYGHTYTASSGGTTSNVYGIKLNPDYGSGTITNMYGLYVSAPLTGGTVSNLYDIYLAPQSLTGVTNNWGIYQANTKNNYFGGNIGIGTTSPSSKLHVVGTNPLTLTGVQTGTNTSADSLLTITNGLVRKLPLSTFSSSTNSWSTTGNAGTTATNFLGTTDSASVRFRTSNTQRLILDSLGNVAIGSNPTFTASPNRERLLIDAGSTASNPTTSFNLINARGYIDNYLQFNIQNNSPTASASTDIVASNDAATETANFIDMGINSSANTSTGAIGGAGTAYLYSTGNDFAIGNGSANKSVVFFTGGLTPSTYTERFRLDASGRVGIGTKTPASDLSIFQSSGTGSSKGVTFAGNSIGGTSSGTGFLLSLGYNATGNKQLWLGDPDFANNSAGTFLRFNTAIGNVAVLDAVAGDNSSRKYVALGVGGDANGGVLFGSDGTATAPASYVWDNGNMTIGNGYKSNAAPSNGLLVQGNVGIGTTSPLTALHVSAASNPLTLNGVQTGSNTDSILTITGGTVRKLSPSAITVSSSNAWALVGNNNTLASNYFLGTTNSDPLIIKVNNQPTGRIDAVNTYLGYQSGYNNGTTANQSTGIGYHALFSNTSGTYNTAIGYGALQGNASGSSNIGVGYGAAVTNNSSNSIAIGTSANTNNSNSIAIGNTAQTNNTNAISIGNNTYTNGNYGIAIGSGPGSPKTQAYADYSMAFGYNAYAGGTNAISIGQATNSTQPNSISLGNASSATGTNSTAIGYNAAATSDNTIVLGDKSNAAVSVAIGSENFSASPNREKLLVDATTIGSFNVISARGNLNNYLQLNVQNKNAGTNASSDLVATTDNGDENNNYVDLGINSSGNNSNLWGSAGDAYLYAQTNNMLIGTAGSSKVLAFLTGGGTQSTNERMRIDGSGRVGIANSSPTEKLDVTGNIKFSGALMPNNLPGAAGQVLTSNGSNSAPIWATFSATAPLSLTGGVVAITQANATTNGYLSSADWNTFNNKAGTSNSWSTTGNAGTTSGSNFLGTTDNTSFKFRTNNAQRMLIDSLGNVAISSSPTFTASPNQEKLLVDAGTTNSYNVISGKGNINNYLQLNIQNSNAGTAASSDVVATADNGNETTNFVDLGINSSANTANFFGAANDAYLYAQSQNMLIGTASNKSIAFLTGGGTQSTNERMRITGAGNVGIGTNAPTDKFDVVGTSGSALVSAFNSVSATDRTIVSVGNYGNNAGGVSLRAHGSSYSETILGNNAAGTSSLLAINAGNGLLTIGTYNAGDVVLGTYNYERMRISGSNGNVGIGTTSPNSTLSVSGSMTVAYRTSLSGNQTISTTDYALINTGAAATWTLPAASTCAGRVYILVNNGTGAITLSQNVTTSNGITSTSLSNAAGSNNYQILSDGTNWSKIN